MRSACYAAIELPHSTQSAHRHLADAGIGVDCSEMPALDIQYLERNENTIQETRFERIEILFVAVEGTLVDLPAVELVLARGHAGRGDHCVAGGRIEAEVVPDVAERECSLVGASFWKYSHR